jgi:hypothetical protein
MIGPSFKIFLKSEDAWVTPFSLMFIAGIFSVTGIAVEYANVVGVKQELQSATDAVALAAVQAMPDEGLAVEYGLELADLYFDENAGVITSSDIEFGVWDYATDEFYASVIGINALQVTATLSTARENSIRAALSNFTGMGPFEVRARSTVYTNFGSLNTGSGCTNGGFFSEGWVEFGSNNEYSSDFCIYGHDGVYMANSNDFGSDVMIGTSSDGEVDGQNNNDIDDDALFTASLDLDLVDLVDNLISDMQNGDLDGIGDFGTYTIRNIGSFDKNDTLIPYSFYIAEGEVDFSKQTLVENVAVVSGDKIKFGSNTIIDNVVLAAEKSIKFGSNVEFSDFGYCTDGRYSNYLFAEDNIEFGSNNDLRAIQMASEKKIKLNSNIVGVADIHAEAGGDIEFGSNTEFSGCDTPLTSDFGEQPNESDLSNCDPDENDECSVEITASWGLVY